MDIGIVIGIIGVVIGLPGFILAWPSIKNFIKSLKARHRIVLFGPIESGKTTLVKYLKNEPLPKEHIPTHSYERTGKIVYDLSGNKTFFFVVKEVVDIGGEFSKQLKPIIKNDNPEAVIFMVDTSKPDDEKMKFEELISTYDEITNEILSEKINLRFFSIILNKCDIWGADAPSQNQMIENYKNNVFQDQIRNLKDVIKDVKIYINATSLLHPAYRIQTNEILRELATLIEEGTE